MSPKQIALLACTVVMVMLTMSGSAIIMVANLSSKVTENSAALVVSNAKIDEQAKLVDKIVANQLAMAPLLDPDHRSNAANNAPATADVTANPVRADQATGDGAKDRDAVSKAGPAMPDPKPVPASPQASISSEPREETILAALASPLSTPPMVSVGGILTKGEVNPTPSAVEPTAPTRVKPAKPLDNVDSILVQRIVSNWQRPPNVHDGLSVRVVIKMARDGRVRTAWVAKSSGDKAYDKSAIQAIRAVRRVPEIQHVTDQAFETLYKERTVDFTPEALSG